MSVITPMELGWSQGHPGTLGGTTIFDWYAAGTSDCGDCVTQSPRSECGVYPDCFRVYTKLAALSSVLLHWHKLDTGGTPTSHHNRFHQPPCESSSCLTRSTKLHIRSQHIRLCRIQQTGPKTTTSIDQAVCLLRHRLPTLSPCTCRYLHCNYCSLTSQPQAQQPLALSCYHAYLRLLAAAASRLEGWPWTASWPLLPTLSWLSMV